MRIPTRAVFLACGLFLSGTLPAGEGITIVYNVTRPDGGPQLGYKFISPGQAEAWSGPDYGFITDSTGKMTRIDHTTWEYTVTTAQEDEAATRALRAMPQRRIDRDTPAAAESSASFEKVPGHRTIAGYDCDHYVATTRTQWNDGRAQPVVVNTHDYWIVPDLHLETVKARMFEMGSRIWQSENAMKDVLDKGLMLADIWSVNGNWVGSEEAIEVRRGGIAPSVFAPPFGYAKVESLTAKLIRERADVEYSAVGTCSHTLFMAAGWDDDKDMAWDVAKRAWRTCVTGKLGEKWTFTGAAVKRCFPREEAGPYSMLVFNGMETVGCNQFGDAPKGKWLCHYNAVACTAQAAPP